MMQSDEARGRGRWPVLARWGALGRAGVCLFGFGLTAIGAHPRATSFKAGRTEERTCAGGALFLELWLHIRAHSCHLVTTRLPLVAATNVCRISIPPQLCFHRLQIHLKSHSILLPLIITRPSVIRFLPLLHSSLTICPISSCLSRLVMFTPMPPFHVVPCSLHAPLKFNLTSISYAYFNTQITISAAGHDMTLFIISSSSSLLLPGFYIFFIPYFLFSFLVIFMTLFGDDFIFTQMTLLPSISIRSYMPYSTHPNRPTDQPTNSLHSVCVLNRHRTFTH
ncbi:hypothetical protein GALMADRAFT_628432 [Galerina marginata CBS 339.88]|uniref:Uncharacterized protein n=1 Tax=Galerina marginata (strain CBS 339.88) TaxID=685588 RepID=A0A067T3U9_GALM3|nr:hypothetical protein GALMADRAFT_628432 [Galerina marginata CBS 339.88]